jgi:hypothetical protein
MSKWMNSIGWCWIAPMLFLTACSGSSKPTGICAGLEALIVEPASSARTAASPMDTYTWKDQKVVLVDSICLTVASAEVSNTGKGYGVDFHITSAAVDAFNAFCAKHAYPQVAFAVDGEILAMATLNSPIPHSRSGEGVIVLGWEEGWSQKRAEKFANASTSK